MFIAHHLLHYTLFLRVILAFNIYLSDVRPSSQVKIKNTMSAKLRNYFYAKYKIDSIRGIELMEYGRVIVFL